MTERMKLLAAAEAAKELIAVLMKQGWQPIETAPRDGTYVLLWCVPHSESKMGSAFAATWESDDDELDYSDWLIPLAEDKEGGWGNGVLRWEPTHWRPLIAPRD
jgi:hypothetical protein